MDQSHSIELPLLEKPIRNDSHFIYYNNIAIFISTVSFFYNIIEGAVSIYFGEVTDSLSLFFFGVQSIVEVLSSVIVLWKVMTSYAEDKSQIRKEKIATVFIGCLFIFLSIGILITGVLSLVNRDYPTTTIPNIIVSATATSIMLCLWVTKVKLAKELNSSTIQSDAQCSLACIRITILLLLGSIVFHFWEGGWWIDGAIALILGILFGKEGITMLIWANNKNFSGGCCGGCAKMPESSKPALTKVRCSTSLKDDYQGIDNLNHDFEAKNSTKVTVGGCCKGGKCSKNENPQSISNGIAPDFISRETDLTMNVTMPPQKAAGGCCKGGTCSKKAQNNIPEAHPYTVPIQEDKPAPSKAGGCCKGGSCSKKAQVTQPAQIILDVPTFNGQVSEAVPLKSEVEAQPPKKAGGCCQGGKCSKKAENAQAAPVQVINTQPIKEAEEYLNMNNGISSAATQDAEPEIVPPKPGGGCCKGGSCSKKPGNLQVNLVKVDDSNVTNRNEEGNLRTQGEIVSHEIPQREDIY